MRTMHHDHRLRLNELLLLLFDQILEDIANLNEVKQKHYRQMVAICLDTASCLMTGASVPVTATATQSASLVHDDEIGRASCRERVSSPV